MRARRYCLMTFERLDMGSPTMACKYVHFKKLEEQEAYDYAEQYSREHDGIVVRLRLRRWCKELHRVEWSTLVSFYNGRLFENKGYSNVRFV